MDYTHIKQLIAQNKLAEARALLLDDTTATGLYLRGRIEWKNGNKARAITFYEAAVAVDPHCEAAVALEQARNVMNFYNKDLYNP